MQAEVCRTIGGPVLSIPVATSLRRSENDASSAKLRRTRTGRALCLLGAGVAALALVGWLTHVRVLFTLLPGQLPMLPNTAIGLLLIGIIGVVHTEDNGLTRWFSM